MSVELRPWRAPDGRVAEGPGRVWVYCADPVALDEARAAAPAVDELVEVEVATPDRLRGLEKRERLPFEFEFVRWLGRVVDAELTERAVALALPAEIVEATLGTLTLRKAHNWYEVKRPSIGRKRYRFVVEVGELGDPSVHIEKSRAVAAWLEPQFRTILATAAERMFAVWDGSWRQDEEDEEDIVDPKSFAKRLSIESVHWNAAKSVDDVVVGIDDGHLFGDHGIDVRMIGQKVTDVQIG